MTLYTGSLIQYSSEAAIYIQSKKVYFSGKTVIGENYNASSNKSGTGSSPSNIYLDKTTGQTFPRY